MVVQVQVQNVAIPQLIYTANIIMLIVILEEMFDDCLYEYFVQYKSKLSTIDLVKTFFVLL